MQFTLRSCSPTHSPGPTQGLSVRLEGSGEVDDGAVFFDGVHDRFRPIEAPDGGRIQGREECQIRVEVVVLPQKLHHLHELENEPLSLFWVRFLQDACPVSDEYQNYFVLP